MNFPTVNRDNAVTTTPKKRRPLVSGGSVVTMSSQVPTISQIAASGPITPEKQIAMKMKAVEKRLQGTKQLIEKLEEAKTAQDRAKLKESLTTSVMLQKEESTAIDQLTVTATTLQFARRKTFAGLQQTSLILELGDEDEEEN